MLEFDEDFIEVNCCKSSITELKELLEGCSYEDVIIPRFCDSYDGSIDKETNSIILLYNFSYNEKIKEVNNEKFKFKYLCFVQHK